MDKETIALVATLVSVALASLGLLAAWYWRQRRSAAKPAAEAHDRSVVAGRDVTGQVATGDQPTVASQAGVMMGPGSTYVEQGLDEESRARLVRIEAKLDELKEEAVAPPSGGPPVDTEALAAEATHRTERLLAEAVQLQRQHKEREAIERLLTAYGMDMPARAKAQLHILVGNGYLRLSELEEAEGHYRQALAAAQQAEDRRAEATALGNLGIVYADRGDLDKAEEHHKRALAIDEEIGNKMGQAPNLGNLGIVYKERGDLDKAEEHHKRALAIDEEIGNRLGQAQDLGNLGLVYAGRGDLEKAEEHFKKALAIHEEIGNRLGQAADLGNLGNIYADRDDVEKAEEYYQTALAIYGEIGNKMGQAQDLGNLGLVAAQRGDVRKARDLLQQAADLYDAIGAGGQGPEIVARALQRLEAPSAEE